jgi:hypothetical protein
VTLGGHQPGLHLTPEYLGLKMANFKKTLDFEKSRQIPIKFDSAAKFESLKSTNYFWDFLGFCTFGLSRHQTKGREGTAFTHLPPP